MCGDKGAWRTTPGRGLGPQVFTQFRTRPLVFKELILQQKGGNLRTYLFTIATRGERAVDKAWLEAQKIVDFPLSHVRWEASNEESALRRHWK